MCACGFTYDSNTIKGENLIIRLHKKKCEIGKNSKEINDYCIKTTNDVNGNEYRNFINSKVKKRILIIESDSDDEESDYDNGDYETANCETCCDNFLLDKLEVKDNKFYCRLCFQDIRGW